MLGRLCLSSVLLMGALVAPAVAEGGGTEKWGQVGGWQIRVDRSHCFAQQLYADGTVLRIGFNAKDRTLYIMLGNDAWRSLEAGKVYVVQAVFDNGKRYDGDLLGKV